MIWPFVAFACGGLYLIAITLKQPSQDQTDEMKTTTTWGNPELMNDALKHQQLQRAQIPIETIEQVYPGAYLAESRGRKFYFYNS